MPVKTAAHNGFFDSRIMWKFNTTGFIL